MHRLNSVDLCCFIVLVLVEKEKNCLIGRGHSGKRERESEGEREWVLRGRCGGNKRSEDSIALSVFVLRFFFRGIVISRN